MRSQSRYNLFQLARRRKAKELRAALDRLSVQVRPEVLRCWTVSAFEWAQYNEDWDCILALTVVTPQTAKYILARPNSGYSPRSTELLREALKLTASSD